MGKLSIFKLRIFMHSLVGGSYVSKKEVMEESVWEERSVIATKRM